MNTSTPEKNNFSENAAVPSPNGASLSSSSPERNQPNQPTHPVQPFSTQPDPLDLVRKFLPPSLRTRKFRADSFAAKLTKPQLATVFAWLQQEPVEDVRAKIAAPAPRGFGMHVHSQTLHRLRNLVSNTELNHWIENAMDATFDILEADTSVDTAPMREALSLLLHTRIMTYVREQINPVSIDRLLSALTRLEKLKTHIAQRPNLINAPREKTTRHKVEVQITTNPGTPAPITIQATHQSLADEPLQKQITHSAEGGEK
jgi:hypothetical protein